VPSKRLQFNILTLSRATGYNNVLLGGSSNCLAIRSYSSLVDTPERLALEHMHSGNTTTNLVINSILSNQKVSITEKN
jgi:hypothetical protein